MTEIHIGKQVAAVRELHRDVLGVDRSQISLRQLLEQQAQNILDAHARSDSAVAFHLGSWCKELVSQSESNILAARLTLEQARQTIATEYGFKSWADVKALGDQAFDVVFESVVDLVITGELSALESALQSHPQLSTQTSQFGHKATLLHYIAANGVESHRQITPLNAADIAQCLIDAGADVNAEANIYGGGSATLGLLLTSAHPANAGVVDQVAEVLRKAGAR